MIEMVKKILVIILVLVMLFTLGACGIRKKIDEKISEKITEGVVNKITGGNADIDFDKGGLTIKGEDGQELTFGSTEWPKGKAANLLPKLKKGNITSVMNSENLSIITIEEIDEKVFNEYIKELKDKGFENDITELSGSSTKSYYATLNENTLVQVIYGVEDKSLNITVQISE